MFVLIGLGTTHLLGDAIQNSSLKSAEQAAFDNLRQRLRNHLTPHNLTRGFTPIGLRRFDRLVRRDVLTDRIVVVKVWTPRGRVVYST
ncbi:MAG TPA: hypothetical protein VG815_17520, partial [Chloroflexota bacterium]|nr:hypothetical protein [Chloroflexota bacterium]